MRVVRVSEGKGEWGRRSVWETWEGAAKKKGNFRDKIKVRTQKQRLRKVNCK
jgi:hypothetical protein